jgi:hypothetical protein
MNFVKQNEEPNLTAVVVGETATTVYEGFPDNNNPLVSAASWAIKRTVMPLTGSITEDWADGNHQKDNVWDNRAALTYKSIT